MPELTTVMPMLALLAASSACLHQRLQAGHLAIEAALELAQLVLKPAQRRVCSSCISRFGAERRRNGETTLRGRKG